MSDASDDDNILPFPNVATERRRLAFACPECDGTNWQLIMVDDVIRFEPDIKLDADADVLFEPPSEQTQSIECSGCGYSLTIMNNLTMVPSNDL